MVRRTYTYGSLTMKKPEPEKKKKKKKKSSIGHPLGVGKYEPRDPNAPGIDLERMQRERRVGLGQRKERVPLADYTPISSAESAKFRRGNEDQMEAAREWLRQHPRQPTPPVPTVSVQPTEPAEQDFYSADDPPTAPVQASALSAEPAVQYIAPRVKQPLSPHRGESLRPGVARAAQPVYQRKADFFSELQPAAVGEKRDEPEEVEPDLPKPQQQLRPITPRLAIEAPPVEAQQRPQPIEAQPVRPITPPAKRRRVRFSPHPDVQPETQRRAEQLRRREGDL